jgi:Protein of unknown function (DUF1214)
MTNKKRFLHSILPAFAALAIAGCSEKAVEPQPTPAAEKPPVQLPYEEEWQKYLAPFQTMGPELVQLLPNPEDEWARLELYEYMVNQVANGYSQLFYADPDHPDWWPVFSHVFDSLWGNPDTVYWYAPVIAEGTYRIAGNRGEARLFDIQLGGGQFVPNGSTDGGMGIVQDNVFVDDLELGENGDFEVTISPERPKGYEGNWIAMTPDTTYLLLRQVSYDWHVPQAELSIERMDTPARGRLMTAEEYDARLKQLAVWVRNWISVSYNISKRDRSRSEEANNFVLVDWMESGFGEQKYYVYAYDLAEDEAVIVENAKPEGCKYWSHQLVTDSWRDINPLKHQSNLNPVTARMDSDDRFRAVIADSDPGVPNWLDVGGNRSALLYTRFNGCPDAEMPSAKVVKLADVRKYLPEDTPEVTPEERDTLLRERSRKAQLRRRL